jgi:hypothetical protein
MIRGDDSGQKTATCLLIMSAKNLEYRHRGYFFEKSKVFRKEYLLYCAAFVIIRKSVYLNREGLY